MAIIYILAYLFLIDQNAVIVHYNKFPNFRVFCANFPNLGPFPKLQKKSLTVLNLDVQSDRYFCPTYIYPIAHRFIDLYFGEITIIHITVKYNPSVLQPYFHTSFNPITWLSGRVLDLGSKGLLFNKTESAVF